MLKYVDAKVVFAEVPDEVTLAINISNCPCQCKGCHSSYLAENIGKPLTPMNMRTLLLINKGISCIAFMGGDSDPKYLNGIAKWIRRNEFRNLKIAWYSGRQELAKEIELKNFDYIKLGSYIKEKGPLNNPNTNQKFYEINRLNKIPEKFTMKDITYKFWKYET